MKIEGPNISSLLKKLKKEDREPFEETYESILEETSDEGVESSIATRLYQERQHVELTKAVASGFCRQGDGSESKFIFNSTDPLSHVNATGADALLVRKQTDKIHLCVVLAEVGDENLSNWISNVNDAIDHFSSTANQGRILDQIGLSTSQIGEIYYSLVARPTDLSDIPFTEIGHRVDTDKFSIWSCDLEDEDEICLEYCEKTHQELRTILDDCFDWAVRENQIEYTIETHEAVVLENVIYRLVWGKTEYSDDEYPLEFNQSDFRDRYKEKLQIWCTEQTKKEIVDNQVAEILELAEQIGIIKEDTNSVRDYRISYQGGDEPLAAKNATESKFLEEATEIRKKSLAYESASEQFDSRQAELGDFGGDTQIQAIEDLGF